MSSQRERAEETLKREARAAARWLKKHGGGDLPTGEFVPDENLGPRRSGFLSGEDQASLETSTEPGAGRSMTSLDQFDTLDDWENWMVMRGKDYTPLVGQRQELTPDEEERRARIEYVMTFMLPVHVDLLRMRYIEQMTLESMAEEFVCSYQNMQSRLRVAAQNFRRAYGQHYWDKTYE